MRTSCPTDISQILYAIHWQNVNNASTDYYNSCDTTGIVSVPANICLEKQMHIVEMHIQELSVAEKDKEITPYRNFFSQRY